MLSVANTSLTQGTKILHMSRVLQICDFIELKNTVLRGLSSSIVASLLRPLGLAKAAGKMICA